MTAVELREKDPERWDAIVSAAHLVTLGMQTQDAAAAVGRSRRQVSRWKADTALWAAAMDEAHERWLAGASAKAKRALMERLDNPEALTDDMLRWTLEKIVAGFGEKPRQHQVAVAVEVDQRDPREVLAEKLNQAAARRGELSNWPSSRSLPAATEPEDDE